MAYFPMFVELKGTKCLVIGGGAVACRKVRSLAEFGAQILVVAKEASPEMLALAGRDSEAQEDREGRVIAGRGGEVLDGEVRLVLRRAKPEDAEGMDLVFCASDDHELHCRIAAYCREHRIPVNAADDKANCSFLFPGLVRQKDVVLGITTGGNSPAASRYLREQIEAQLPDYLGTLVQQLGGYRDLVKAAIPDGKRRERLFSRLFAAGMEREGALPEELVRRMIKQEAKISGTDMKKKIRIGTRKSDLSVAQTMLVVNAMKASFPETEIELVCRSTVGDQILDQPLIAFGGKGVFVSEFEEALLQGTIDFAVHSAKDMPMELAEGLTIAAALPRGDVRDVLVTLSSEERVRRGMQPEIGNSQGEDPDRPIRIGSSSLRRKIQVEVLGGRLWPGRKVICENLRGNVLTRLERLEQGLYDGIILAAAGLERLEIPKKREGRYELRYFTPQEMIPAGGQGILTVEGRMGDEVNRIAEAVSDPLAMEQLLAERLVLRLLGSGCHEPVGVYCRRENGGLRISGIYERDGMRRRKEIWEPDAEEDAEDCWERGARRLARLLLGQEECR